MRRLLAAPLLAAALTVAGCNASGESGGSRRFSDRAVPFTFSVPTGFTDEPVDRSNTHGDVVAAAGLTKVDVIAVRQIDKQYSNLGGGRRPTAEVVLGQSVKSELHPVPGFAGWFLECQYTGERADEVRKACDHALRSVKRR